MKCKHSVKEKPLYGNTSVGKILNVQFLNSVYIAFGMSDEREE